MGSSGRANGGIRAQFSTHINIEFSRYTIDALTQLNEWSHGLVGLRRNGYLFMTGTQSGEESLRRAFEMQRALGVAVRWLSEHDVSGLAPFVRTAGLRAGTFSAEDGVVDPAGVVAALTHECRKQGGIDFHLGADIAGIEPHDDHVSVRTSHGVIEAEYVVNAAGPQARRLAAMTGLDLPVTAYRHNLVCTEPVAGFPDAIPMCVDMDTGVLIRREAGGFLIGYSDPHATATEEMSFDPTYLEMIAQRVPNRFPFLSAIPVNERKCWAGLYPETPDHHAIIDSAPGLERFIQCAGFGGHGIMHSLAAGRAVAELVTRGRCTTFDLRPLRLSRFVENDTVVEEQVL